MNTNNQTEPSARTRREQYTLDLFTRWCECSPYGEQIPDKWPELMAEFAKKHANKDRDFMAELFSDGDGNEPFDKLLESIFDVACEFVIGDLSNAVYDNDPERLSVIGFTPKPSNPSPDRPVEVDLERLREALRNVPGLPWEYYEIPGTTDGIGYIRPNENDWDGREIHHVGDMGWTDEQNKAIGRITVEAVNSLPAILSHITTFTQDNAELKAELETQKLSTEFAGNEVVIRNATIDRLEATLSQKDGEVNVLRSGLEALMEVWKSDLISGRLTLLALRRGGTDGTDAERAWVKERVDKAEATLTPSPGAVEQRTDKERLDWMITNGAAILLAVDHEQDNGPVYEVHTALAATSSGSGSTARKAIDAAMPLPPAPTENGGGK